MKNNPLAIKLRNATASLTWSQIKNLSKQQVIANMSFDADELLQLRNHSGAYLGYIKGAWLRSQHEAFIAGKIRDVMVAARTDAVDYMVLQGVSDETAKKLFKDGFQVFSDEVLNG